MNRVSTRKGRLPVIVVAPHGNQDDDMNTDIIADCIATELDAYSVINTGWRRGDKAVLGENIANLNDVNHCKLKPVRKEFLDPLLAFKDAIINKSARCHVFYIHGMSNKIRHVTKDRVDIVIGYGAGNPPSYTCDSVYKNAMVTRFEEENLCTYQGKSGGRFSAWKPENLTQIFRRKHLDQRVQGVQLEIVNLRRYDEGEAIKTALAITRSLDKFLHSTTKFNKNMVVQEY